MDFQSIVYLVSFEYLLNPCYPWQDCYRHSSFRTRHGLALFIFFDVQVCCTQIVFVFIANHLHQETYFSRNNRQGYAIPSKSAPMTMWSNDPVPSATVFDCNN